MKTLARRLLPLVLAALPAAAQAASYRIDLIVFLDKNNAPAEAPQPAAPIDTSKALEVLDTAKLRDAGIEIAPDDTFALTDQWQRLRNSRRLEPILRLAWIQKDPPAEHGPELHLRWGAALPPNNAAGSPAATTAMYPVDGTVSLLASRYLHLDADLVYTQAAPDGTLVSYRLNEKRRMKRDELHYLDSPRLGILARVQKADQPEKAKPKPAPAAKPKVKKRSG